MAWRGGSRRGAARRPQALLQSQEDEIATLLSEKEKLVAKIGELKSKVSHQSITMIETHHEEKIVMETQISQISVKLKAQAEQHLEEKQQLETQLFRVCQTEGRAVHCTACCTACLPPTPVRDYSTSATEVSAM